MIAIEHVLGYILSVGAMIITVVIAMNKTRKEIQNGISQRLSNLEHHTTKQSADIKWVIKEMGRLPCVRDPGKYTECDK